MFLKVLNGFSQATIITLALVLIVTITNKHSSNVVMEDYQRQVNERLDADRSKFESKIKTVEDSLNRYQQIREARAQLFGKRLDELYDLYKKDPSPIDSANSSLAQASSIVIPKESFTDKNFIYLENKCNRSDEKIDTLDNKVMSRLTVLEQKIELLQQDKKNNSKVIQNNITTVGNVTTR